MTNDSFEEHLAVFRKDFNKVRSLTGSVKSVPSSPTLIPSRAPPKPTSFTPEVRPSLSSFKPCNIMSSPTPSTTDIFSYKIRNENLDLHSQV
ncbi:hypothetical protein RCL1_008655 [Eukaryota sp. TZLM3-RCL]